MPPRNWTSTPKTLTIPLLHSTNAGTPRKDLTMLKTKHICTAALAISSGAWWATTGAAPYSPSGWVHAFSEAAIVGGLADWFAVVALFRKPMGLPIPHTAILPSKKDALAQGLAHFVHAKLLSTPQLLARIEKAQPTQSFFHWLQNPVNRKTLNSLLRSSIAQVLAVFDDNILRQVAHSALQSQLTNANIAPLLFKTLKNLTTSEHMEPALTVLLTELAHITNKPDVKAQIASVIKQAASTEYPTLLKGIGFFTDTAKISEKLAQATANALAQWLTDLASTPDNPQVQSLLLSIQSYAAQWETDPKAQDWVNSLKENFLHELQGDLWLQTAIDNLRLTTLSACKNPESKLAIAIDNFLTAAAIANAGEPTIAVKAVEKEALRLLTQVLPHVQSFATKHIEATIRDWSPVQLTNELERALHNDLQFIRLNGTVVGGALGLLLHACALFR